MEEAHKEALAIAEERWARIFNHNCPVAGRAHDPPDRKMVWGTPEDTAKHPDGEEHIRLRDLPRLLAMVTRVKAKLEAILGKTLHVMTQDYIQSITHVRQLPHRDFPAVSLPVDGIALSVFWALSMDIPDDEVCAQFVAMSARVFPRPWIIHRMPMRRGSLRVICSTVVHEGGGLPLAAEPGSRRIIGFCGLSTHTVSYATTHAITPPFWAHKAAVSCGVHGCRRKPTSEKCFGCAVQLLCRSHTGMECSKCDTEAVAAAASDAGSAEAADPSRVPALQHTVTCLIPSDGTTLYTGHYEAAPAPHAIPADTTPKPEDCPLVGHAHESEWLPWPRSEHHALLVTPPGSILVVVNGRFGGFARGAEESSDVLVYRMEMAPPEPRPVDPSLLMAAGAIVRNTKVAQEQAFWCACQQVDTLSPLNRGAFGWRGSQCNGANIWSVLRAKGQQQWQCKGRAVGGLQLGTVCGLWHVHVTQEPPPFLDRNCPRNPPGTPFLHRNPPPFLHRNHPRNPQEPPPCTGTPPPLPAQEPPFTDPS